MKKESKFVICLDQGTTSSRTILFNDQSELVFSSQQEFNQIFPSSGWVEHDPMEILKSQKETLLEVIKHSKKQQLTISCLGITNQRETIIAWNKKTGKPYHNAIVWQDTRTSDYCNKLRTNGIDNLIREKTGLILDSYFSASKMKWILDNIDDASRDNDKGELLFGTVDTWLIWNLTNGQTFATDSSNASRTMLFNINSLEWDEELLDLFGIKKESLPEVKNSADDFGTLTLDNISIPISAVAGDQQSALFGQTCFKTGMAKNTYGTGCFMLMNTGNERITSQNNLLTTIAWTINGKATYALEGSVFVAGSAIQWLRDGLQIIENAKDSEELALQANQNQEVYVVPAFAGLGAPHWDMYARGGILGLTRGVGIPEIVKATLDSLAYQTKDVLDAMQKDSGIDLKTLQVDGGACANNYLMQFQSDILQKNINRPSCKESTALGVAYLAGIQSGLWRIEELTNIRKTEKEFSPKFEKTKQEYLYAKWNKAVDRVRNWSE